MKKLLKIAMVILLSSVFANAQENVDKKPKMAYQAVSPNKATIVQKGDEKQYCPICGMTLPMFYKTNHAAHKNGEEKQYCSIHCMVEDKEVNGSNLTNMRVVDNTTLKLIDVKEAYYVVGSSKPGTMSMVSKYAFENEDDAKKFQEDNGGEIKRFDEVYDLVSKGMQEEKEMIKKRQAKAAMMGEKLYNKMCKKIDQKFDSVAQAKAFIVKNKSCGEMKGKPLQQVGLYLGNR